MLKHPMDAIMKATVTKSRPGQEVGLMLEERNSRIYVTDINGLFKRSGVPVHVGDQLLEVNGISVTNQDEFPNGLKDVELFLRRGWSIWVKVKKAKVFKDDLDDTATTVASEASYFSKLPHNEGSDSEHSTIEYSDDEEIPQARKPRSQRSSSKPRRKSKPRSRSPFSALATVEKKRAGRKTKNRRSRKKASHESESGSVSTDTTHSLSADDDTPPRAETRTCRNGELVSIDEDDAALLSPLTPHGKNSTTKHSTEPKIKSIKGTDQEITVEMESGKCVSVTPQQLLKAVSSKSNLNVGAPTVYDPDQKPKSKLEALADEVRTLDAPDLSSLSLTNVLGNPSTRMSLSRILSEHGKKPRDLSAKPASYSIHSVTPPATKNFVKHLRTQRRSSLQHISSSEDRTRAPLRNIKAKKTRRRSASPSSSTHSCMTNLIDPGDLMKIHGFTSKPKMNGSTVEVVRKSKGTKGQRWDVRMISKKHIKNNTSFNTKRLISVATVNLKHFM